MALENCEIVAFLATTKPEEARAFYCDILGMKLKEDAPFALVLSGPNATIRIQKLQSFAPLPFTALGWRAHDIKAAIKELVDKGVKFERFDSIGMKQDESGVWVSPSGARVCWFKDPDGNLLSLTQDK